MKIKLSTRHENICQVVVSWSNFVSDTLKRCQGIFKSFLDLFQKAKFVNDEKIQNRQNSPAPTSRFISQTFDRLIALTVLLSPPARVWEVSLMNQLL